MGEGTAGQAATPPQGRRAETAKGTKAAKPAKGHRSVLRSLAVRQATRAMVTALLIGLLLTAVEVAWATSRERGKVARLVDQILNLTETTAATALWNIDERLAGGVASSTLQLEGVAGFEIMYDDGRPFWSQWRARDGAGRGQMLEAGMATLVFADLVVAERILNRPYGNPAETVPIGRVVLHMNPTAIAADLENFVVTSVLGGLVRNILLGLALSWMFHAFLTRPLIALGRSLIRVRADQPLADPIKAPAGHEDDELGYVASRINEMLGHLHRSQEELRRLATRDSLTALPNRTLLVERLNHAISRAHRTGRQMAVLFLDLDRFKHINDSLGHGAGDELLKAVGARLQEALREGDTVGRLGGDEFLVLAEDLDGPDAVGMIGGRLVRAFDKSFILGDHVVHTAASIGAALYPEDGTDPETLMRHADVAMYAAKATNPGSFTFFRKEMTERAMVRLRTEASLRDAIRLDQLEVHYQPKVTARGRRLAGVEALVRWQFHGQYLPPTDFIPVAEETGLICELGEIVLRQACRDAAAWNVPDLTVAVNVSARQLENKDFPERVRDIVAESGFPPERVILEVTESVVMRDLAAQLSILNRLRGYGFGIAVDDFGTGYSSLSYLRQLPVTVLKIDRSFVRDLPDDPVIASTVVALGAKLGLKTVAEGVETEGQFAWLAQEGCDLIQGFLISKAVPAATLAERFLGRAATEPVPAEAAGVSSRS